MTLLNGLDGTVASIVLCAILFVDETGVPVPFAPNEVLLLIAGVLIRTGAISVWTFIPAAIIVMTAGMLLGYSGARAVGQPGLQRLVTLVHAEAAHQRIMARLNVATPLHIGVARLLPGVRPWTTLSCGAMGIPLQRFLLGAVPALLVWVVVWTALGILIGLPIAHFLGVFQKLLVRGVLMLAVGVAAYASLRRLQRQGLLEQQRRAVWLPLALLVTGGAAASMVAGVLAIGRGFVGDDGATWVDALLVAVVMAAVGGLGMARDRRRRVA